MSDFMDSLWGDTPEEERRRLMDEADKVWADAEQYTCFFGNCTWFYDAEQGEIIGGFGIAGCPCEDDDDEKMMLWQKIPTE